MVAGPPRSFADWMSLNGAVLRISGVRHNRVQSASGDPSVEIVRGEEQHIAGIDVDQARVDF